MTHNCIQNHIKMKTDNFSIFFSFIFLLGTMLNPFDHARNTWWKRIVFICLNQSLDMSIHIPLFLLFLRNCVLMYILHSDVTRGNEAWTNIFFFLVTVLIICKLFNIMEYIKGLDILKLKLLSNQGLGLKS